MAKINTESELLLKEKIKKSLTVLNPISSRIKSKAKKQNNKKNDLPMFCTECGKELDLFWLTDKASNKDAVNENFQNCNSTGKFKGHYCSKMFISGVYIEKVLKKKK